MASGAASQSAHHSPSAAGTHLLSLFKKFEAPGASQEEPSPQPKSGNPAARANALCCLDAELWMRGARRVKIGVSRGCSRRRHSAPVLLLYRLPCTTDPEPWRPSAISLNPECASMMHCAGAPGPCVASC